MKLFTRLLLLLLLSAGISQKVSATIVPSFTADVTTGCAPLLVHLTNTSTGTGPGDTYYWSFGAGFSTSSGYGVPVSTTFLSPGTFTIILTITSATGATYVYTLPITVFPDPIVSFTGTPRAGCPGTTVSFASTTTPGAPGPMTYTWDFGDGGTLGPSTSLITTSHTYGTSGFWHVKLHVTNSNGCTSFLDIDSFVNIYAPPNVSFNASSTSICHAPGTVTFTALPSGFGPFSCVWDFGDGSPTVTGSSPSHTYTTPGSYTVTLTVTDGHGCTSSLTRTGYIYVSSLVANFSYTTTACAYTTVSFANTSSSVGTSAWDFGDFTSATTATPTHVYTAAGVYNVQLIDGYMGCADTIVHTINIIPRPPLSVVLSSYPPCPAPTPVTFTAVGPPSTTIYNWTFGNHSSGVGSPFTYTRPIRGIDTNYLTTYDPVTGCRDSLVIKDTMYDMVHSMHQSVFSGCKPVTVSFYEDEITFEPDTSISPHPYPYSVVSYAWDFDDGSPVVTTAAPTHTYTAVGMYRPRLMFTTSNGCTFYDTGNVLVGTPPLVSISVIPSRVCYGHPVDFIITTISGTPNSFFWAYGDTRTDSNYAHPVNIYTYLYPGVFVATMTPYFNGCPGPKVTSPVITIDSPMAHFTTSVSCTPRNLVYFTNTSVGDDSHIWFFGDGDTSTLRNPTHAYPALIIYTVTLTTYNIRSGCRDTFHWEVDLRTQIVDFSANRTRICRDDTITFTSWVTGGNVANLNWFKKLGSSRVQIPGILPTYAHDAIITDTFHVRGVYDIWLAFSDQRGCPDTVKKVNYVTVAKPIAAFNFTPTSGCWPLVVHFTDASVDVTGTTLTRFAWNFGDGSSAASGSPTINHTYTAAGTYIMHDTVTDDIGCKDTGVNSTVTVYRPHASMIPATLYPCIGVADLFNNTSVGITSSFWYFGDGDTSSLTSPTHVYSTAGVYTVKLIVTDAHGCFDTAVYNSYINVTKPHAGFYMDDSFAICPPLLTHFYNTSTSAYSYAWDFGDGNTSLFLNPADLYSASGLYTIRLIAYNMYGCTDTAYGHTNIYGYAGAFSYGPLKGCAPLTVKFGAHLSNVPNIVWDFVDGTTLSTALSDSATHIYSTPGAYLPRLILSDNTGCHSSSVGIDTIKVDAVIPGFTTVPNPVCLNGLMHFDDTSRTYFSPITQWLWTFTNGDTSTLESPSHIYTAVGTYSITLTATNEWGCVGTVTHDVLVYPAADITASPDTVICLGDKATLIGYGGVKYVWSPPVSLSCTACNPAKAGPGVPTTYTVTGTDSHGCTNFDTVMVSIKTKTVSRAQGDTEVCWGISVQLLDSGGTTYTWIPANGLDNNHIANPIATPDFSTNYLVIAQLASCEPDSNWVKVIVHPLPVVDAGPDQRLMAGSIAQLQATGSNVSVYEWGEVPSLSCDSCAAPVASMSVTTTYEVLATSSFGCKKSDTVTIFIFCDAGQVFIPNAFTPNGDGQNDVFFPRGKGVKLIKTFRIYNRWGQMVFEREGLMINDASNAWDGAYLGGSPRPDVYMYIVEAICDTGEPINLKGDVTIIR